MRLIPSIGFSGTYAVKPSTGSQCCTSDENCQLIMIKMLLSREFDLRARLVERLAFEPWPEAIWAPALIGVQAAAVRAYRRAVCMHRFYRLDVQPDLFGGVLLMKEWGRIGAQGRMVAEPYHNEALATAALHEHTERKRWRGCAER